MTNREWLFSKMQNMSDEEFAEMISNGIDIDLIIPCNPHCDYSSECEDCTINWLKSEHKEKITLSEAERVILENIDKKYKWLVREKCGRLCLQNDMEKPYKDDESWQGYGIELDFFDHLFQFITWNDSEPYNIEELLKGE